MIIDGGILAGGLSRRFGERDKALASYRGRPMVEHVFDSLRPHVRHVLLNTQGESKGFKHLDAQCVQDSRPDFPGPLAGIETLIKNSDADYVLIAPCDSPGLHPQFASSMLDVLASSEPIAPLLGLKVEDDYYPLHLCIHQSMLRHVTESLDDGEYRVMKWMQQHQARWVDIPQMNTDALNINTPQQLAHVQMRDGE